MANSWDNNDKSISDELEIFSTPIRTKLTSSVAEQDDFNSPIIIVNEKIILFKIQSTIVALEKYIEYFFL